MTQRTLEIVITCDEGYLGPLRTMLLSLRANNRAGSIRVWLLHRGIPQVALKSLAVFCGRIKIELAPRMVDQALFAHTRSSERYPQEMYYRMLAPHVIDADIDRALYLDPDILIINPLAPLFDIELGDCVFAAASHTDAVHPATALNNVRLNTNEVYFNTGVILMDMRRAKALIDPDEIFAFAREHERKLLFPDQDIFNALYGERTLPVPDQVWNYDARKYPDNIIRTGGEATLDWVMNNTAILHFCGRDKPWAPKHRGQFAALYKHYATLARRI
ncbi:MAG: glycosyltransferase family 8 protein [Collinsella intestinalis]